MIAWNRLIVTMMMMTDGDYGNDCDNYVEKVMNDGDYENDRDHRGSAACWIIMLCGA